MDQSLSKKTPAEVHGAAVKTKARLNSVDAACERLGVGRTLLYRALNPNRRYRRGLPHLKSVMLGGKRLISDEAIELYIAELERQADAETSDGEAA